MTDPKPSELAKKIARLWGDESLAQHISENGLADLEARLADLEGKHAHLETVLDQSRRHRTDLEARLEAAKRERKMLATNHTKECDGYGCAWCNFVRVAGELNEQQRRYDALREAASLVLNVADRKTKIFDRLRHALDQKEQDADEPDPG
jgi:hypothetical protein